MATMTDAEAQISAALREINAATGNKPQPVNKMPHPPREEFRFVSLSEQLADAIVDAYQQQLNSITNKLEQAKNEADLIRQENKKRADDLHDFTRRVEEFGATLVGAHHRFHDGSEED